MVVVVAGCGGTPPEDQVRATAQRTAEALTGPHPERACQYMADHDACIGSIALANSMRIEVSAAVGIPPDWRARLARTKVVVNGGTARFGRATYVRRGDRWLLDNS